jgi:hypothetical protein
MTKLTTDEKTYRSSYAAGEYNAIMEIEALETGLCIDESVTVPWDWILRAATLHQSEDGKLADGRKPAS